MARGLPDGDRSTVVERHIGGGRGRVEREALERSTQRRDIVFQASRMGGVDRREMRFPDLVRAKELPNGDRSAERPGREPPSFESSLDVRLGNVLGSRVPPKRLWNR